MELTANDGGGRDKVDVADLVHCLMPASREGRKPARVWSYWCIVVTARQCGVLEEVTDIPLEGSPVLTTSCNVEQGRRPESGMEGK